MDREVVGTVIRNLRISKRLSQEVLSGLAGMDRSHLSKIELGQSGLSLEMLFKIAYALDMPAHKLILEIEQALEK